MQCAVQQGAGGAGVQAYNCERDAGKAMHVYGAGGPHVHACVWGRRATRACMCVWGRRAMHSQIPSIFTVL